MQGIPLWPEIRSCRESPYGQKLDHAGKSPLWLEIRSCRKSPYGQKSDHKGNPPMNSCIRTVGPHFVIMSVPRDKRNEKGTTVRAPLAPCVGCRSLCCSVTVVKSLWRCVCRAGRRAEAQNLSSRVVPPAFRNSASTAARCASDSVSGPRMLCGFGLSLFGFRYRPLTKTVMGFQNSIYCCDPK